MNLSRKITAFVLAISFFSVTPCYAIDSASLLSHASMTDGTIEQANNALYFLDRNPCHVTFVDDYTGAYQWEGNHHLYCIKNGETVKFTPEYLRSWHAETKSESGLEQATKDFLYAYENHFGYNEVFWHTDDIREVFVFEMFVSDALSNSLLPAGQDNVVYIEYDNANPDIYAIKMNSAEAVEKFRHEIEITNQVLQECDALVNTTQDPFEKIKRINNLITEKLTYNNDRTVSAEGYTEIDALCYNTGTMCAGYCNLFKLLCERYGIETKNVETDPNQDGYHAWSANLIDGNWYYTDTTWNENWDNYFLLLTEEEMNLRRTEALLTGTEG